MVDRRRMRKPPEIRIPPASGFAIGPHYVAAVDSAKHAPAWALGHSGQLQAVGFDKEPGVGDPDGWPFGEEELGASVVALEVSPPRGDRDGNPHNVFEQNVGGALTAGSMRGGSLVQVFPDEWAGTTKKPPRHWAIWQVLTKSERMLVAAAGGFALVVDLEHHIERACESLAYGQKVKYTHEVHNILDAVGLFLFAVGRIKRGGNTVEKRPRFQGIERPGSLKAQRRATKKVKAT